MSGLRSTALALGLDIDSMMLYTASCYSYGDANWRDKLTAYDGVSISYDAIGNPLDYVRNLSFSWEKGSRLTEVSQRGNGAPIAEYTYNPSGIRTSKTVYVNGVPETTVYTLDGDRVVREECGNDVIWYYYDAEGGLIGFELNGDAYYYVKNLQGDIVRILDSSGCTVVYYIYSSWGALWSMYGSLASSVGVKNPYRYRGYRYDAETGLYYLQSR